MNFLINQNWHNQLTGVQALLAQQAKPALQKPLKLCRVDNATLQTLKNHE